MQTQGTDEDLWKVPEGGSGRQYFAGVRKVQEADVLFQGLPTRALETAQARVLHKRRTEAQKSRGPGHYGQGLPGVQEVISQHWPVYALLRQVLRSQLLLVWVPEERLALPQNKLQSQAGDRGGEEG